MPDSTTRTANRIAHGPNDNEASVVNKRLWTSSIILDQNGNPYTTTNTLPITPYDSLGNAMEDGFTSSLKTVDYAHHEMHSGNHYFIKTFLVDTGGSGSTSYFAFTTPDTTKWAHAKALLAPDADTEINIYENADITGGTPIKQQNCNRNFINGAGLAPLAAPTVNDAGDLMWAARTGGGRNPVGVASGFNYEIIAKQNTSYLFEIIKRTTADLVIDIDFFWYEHTSNN